MLDRQNHAAGGANGSIMVGMFVCLCLTSKKPSERVFFVPAGTDLGVKLLTHQVVEYRINLTEGTYTLLKPTIYPGSNDLVRHSLSKLELVHRIVRGRGNHHPIIFFQRVNLV
jgi:hypothetical protein